MRRTRARERANDPAIIIDGQSLSDLQLTTPAGGLIILGPTAKPLEGIKTLLSSPEVEAIVASAAALTTWKRAPAEVVEVTRQASRVIRRGHAAVVHLDSHLDPNAAIAEASHPFVAARLGQIMMGIADQPAYVALHGEELAQSLIVDTLGDEEAPTLGTIGGSTPVKRFTDRTMFAGIPVAICPALRAATVVAQVLDWFEARRV